MSYSYWSRSRRVVVYSSDVARLAALVASLEGEIAHMRFF